MLNPTGGCVQLSLILICPLLPMSKIFHDKVSKTCKQKKRNLGTPLAVQWLGLCSSTAGGMGMIPGWGTKIPPCCGVQSKFFLFKRKEETKYINADYGYKNRTIPKMSTYAAKNFFWIPFLVS